MKSRLLGLLATTVLINFFLAPAAFADSVVGSSGTGWQPFPTQPSEPGRRAFQHRCSEFIELLRQGHTP